MKIFWAPVSSLSKAFPQIFFMLNNLENIAFVNWIFCFYSTQGSQIIDL